MKLISIKQEREFEKSNVLKRKEKYIQTNPLDRYKNDEPYRKKIDFIKNKLVRTNGLILDIGGNTAGEATILQTFGYKFVVGDINEFALSISKERIEKFQLDMPYYVALDAHILPFENEVFDQVTIIEALHHFVNYKSVLDEVSRVLKPGGNFVSLEPYAYNPIRKASEIRDYFKGTIEKSFSVRQLKKLLESSNFQNINIEFISTGRSKWKLEEIPLFRRWFARLHGYLNEKFPKIFGNLLITAKKNGQFNDVSHNINFIDILHCPITKEKLHMDYEHNILINESKTLGYKFYNEIPVLIKEDAIKL
jgi:demethylmenaquinone methyltransferase/2-methoxy-6-polyprenyl-1,4-benzoquinol methylase